MRSLPRSLPPLLLLTLAAPLRAQAPAPVLQEIFPPGGQPGATVRVTLSGKRLGRVQSIWFDHPGLSATRREEEPSQPDPARKDGEKKDSGKKESKDRSPAQVWEIAIDRATPPGLYDLRVVNELGISAPRAFHVSRLPLRADRDPAEGRAVAVEVNERIAGWVEPGVADRFTFRAPRKERVVVECLAERIDSRLDATLEVRDASGRRVAYSADRISEDPALAIDAEEGADYTIDLWDFTYGGRYPYLLSISSAPQVLFACPPALAPGAPAEVTLYGWNLPGGRAVDGGAGEPLEALAVTLPGSPIAAAGRTYRTTTGVLDRAVEAAPLGPDSAPLVFARVDAPPLSEREPNDTPSAAAPLPVPFTVCGRFETPGDRDWYSFRAAKGQSLEIEVLSARLGFPCDPVLLVARREVGKEPAATAPSTTVPSTEGVRDLLFLDERKGGYPREESFQRKFVASERDPQAVWTAPEDGEYLLQVRNRNGRHGPGAVYLLAAREPASDFSLVVIHSENQSGEAASVPQGGSQSYDVLIERRGGFNGVVEITAEGLPEGVDCPAVYLGPGERWVPLVFTSTPAAKAWTGSVRVVGRASLPAEGGRPAEVLAREATSAVMIYGGAENRHPQEYVHSRLAASTLLAVREPAPFLVRLEPEGKTAAPGGKVSFQARVERKEGFREGVQLSFQGLSENSTPDGDGARPAKATLAGDKSSQEVSISIKNDSGYGRRTVVVYATAPVEYAENPLDPKSKKEKRRTTFASNPVTVEVSPPFSLLTLGAPGAVPAGGELKIPFRVQRLAGVDEEVEVSLDLPGDPKGLTAAPVKVAKGESAGEVRLVSAAGAPRRIEGAALRGRMQFAGKRFDERVVLPARVAGPKVFELTRFEEARLHTLRFEIGARAGHRPAKDVGLEVSLVAPSGRETRTQVVLPAGRRACAVLADCAGLVSGGESLFPLRVQIQTGGFPPRHGAFPPLSPRGDAQGGGGAFPPLGGVTAGGEVFEEHLLEAPAPGGIFRGPARSF